MLLILPTDCRFVFVNAYDCGKYVNRNRNSRKNLIKILETKNSESSEKLLILMRALSLSTIMLQWICFDVLSITT